MKQSSFLKALYGVLLVMTIAACASKPPVASGEMSLDAAIQEAAVDIDGRIEAGTKIALLNFDSPSDKFSEYVLDELTANLVESGKLTIVDRKEVDLIRSEFDFQFSGEVGDDSMQELGRMLGAQSIVSGSLTDMGGFYRIVIRVLNVQSASVEVQYRTNIANDRIVTALLSGGKSGGTAKASGGAGAQAASGAAPAAAAPPAALAKPAGPKPGTYTFYPRPQVTKAGLGMKGYLDKIVVSGKYMTIYLCNAPRGINDGRAEPYSWYLKYNVLLTDLDNPAKTYKPTGHSELQNEAVDSGEALSFENVSATRFSLECADGGQYIFDEITLGEPDAQ